MIGLKKWHVRVTFLLASKGNHLRVLYTEQGSKSVRDSVYVLSCPPAYRQSAPETEEWHMFCNNSLLLSVHPQLVGKLRD